MKKILLIAVMLLSVVSFASAQNEAKIKFDKLTYNFGIVQFHQRGQVTLGDQPGGDFLRLHGGHLH